MAVAAGLGLPGLPDPQGLLGQSDLPVSALMVPPDLLDPPARQGQPDLPDPPVRRPQFPAQSDPPRPSPGLPG